MKKEKNHIIQNRDGVEMAGDYFEPENHTGELVLYLHGFNGFKDWGHFDQVAMQFVQQGFAFAKFNFSHNGTSAEYPEDFVDLKKYGNNNYLQEIQDTEDIIHYLKEVKKPEKIHLLGHSRGGGIALLSSGNPLVDKIISWAGIAECTSPWRRFSEEMMIRWKKEGVWFYPNKRTGQQMPLYYQLYENYMTHKELLDIQRAVRESSKKILLIHGKKDEVVPYTDAEKLYNANPQNVTLILNESDHTFGRKHPWLENEPPVETLEAVRQSIAFLRGEALNGSV